MKKVVPLKELFEPIYGVNLELVHLEVCDKRVDDSIRFISRKESDNGVAAYVKRIEGVEPNPAHTLSVAVSGSVLSTFYQDQEYYSGRDIYYLLPKRVMSVEEMIFYAFCIEANKYKYNYGRGANRTLRDIPLPDRMPPDFGGVSISKIAIPPVSPLLPEQDFKFSQWRPYVFTDLFKLKKGKRLTKEDMVDGATPFIGAIDSNNGYREFIGQHPIHDGNTITVNYNGSVAESFYQPLPFWASDDVNVLYPKFEMNVYVALFICTVIENEKYRFNFGRKWHIDRMEKSVIYLPSKNDKPDFLFMEKFIKSLPYSAAIMTNITSAKPPKQTKERIKKNGLSDAELIEKYETGGKVDFDSAIKKMSNTPSSFNEAKKKSGQTSH